MGARAAAKLVVVSGPSGAGKTTVLKDVFRRQPIPLVASVSATTRPPRPNEKDGVDYHFLTDDQFADLRRRGDFLECVEVFGCGHWYGTLRSEVTTGLEAGKWVVLEIDVEGAMKVLGQFPDAVSIFISPGSGEELERRLRGRGTESEAAIQRRLERAMREMAYENRYRHVVINDEVDRAVEEICQILLRERGGYSR